MQTLQSGKHYLGLKFLIGQLDRGKITRRTVQFGLMIGKEPIHRG